MSTPTSNTTSSPYLAAGRGSPLPARGRGRTMSDSAGSVGSRTGGRLSILSAELGEEVLLGTTSPDNRSSAGSRLSGRLAIVISGAGEGSAGTPLPSARGYSGRFSALELPFEEETTDEARSSLSASEFDETLLLGCDDEPKSFKEEGFEEVKRAIRKPTPKRSAPIDFKSLLDPSIVSSMSVVAEEGEGGAWDLPPMPPILYADRVLRWRISPERTITTDPAYSEASTDAQKLAVIRHTFPMELDRLRGLPDYVFSDVYKEGKASFDRIIMLGEYACMQGVFEWGTVKGGDARLVVHRYFKRIDSATAEKWKDVLAAKATKTSSYALDASRVYMLSDDGTIAIVHKGSTIIARVYKLTL